LSFFLPFENVHTIYEYECVMVRTDDNAEERKP